jgi:hypothetical protein
MKRYSSLLAGLLFAVTLATPMQAEAMSWDWVPRVLGIENPYRGLDATRYPGFECKKRNSWGDCVIFNYITENVPNKQKNYYRRVSSFRGSDLNYSDCQYDDYKRSTAPATRYAICDYGTPQY